MSRRWLEAGWSLRYNDAITVKHYHGLTVKRYFNQHFRYGMGSGQFHEKAGYQSKGFYWRLLTDAPRTKELIPGLQISALIVLSQVANLAGHLRVFCTRQLGPLMALPPIGEMLGRWRLRRVRPF